jgi:hypothetical protein
MDKLPEPKITEKYEMEKEKIKEEKTIVKKHLDELFQKDFLNDYFKELEKTSKKDYEKSTKKKTLQYI